MRSLLFVPGDGKEKLDKALACGADVVIVDLEDGVSLAGKGEARKAAAAFLGRVRPQERRPALWVRINALETDLWREDLAAIMPAAPDGIMLPKPRGGQDVERLALALDKEEDRLRRPAGATRIIAIATETPHSLLAMQTYVKASPRLEALAWGAEDLSVCLGAMASRNDAGAISSPFRLARDLCLIGAAAAGVAAIDAPFLDFRDLTGLSAEARAAARDGFAGKMAIHPDQVGIINAAFTPSEAEIAEAAEIVALFARAPAEGVVSRGGRMLDRPHLDRAQRLLTRARRAGIAV